MNREIQRKHCKFRLSAVLKKMKQKLSTHFRGDFGSPRLTDHRAFFLAARLGDFQGCRAYVLKFCTGTDRIAERDRPINATSAVDGKTALCLVAEKDTKPHFEIAKLLLNEGISLTLRDCFYRTALHYCCISGASDTVEVFLQKVAGGICCFDVDSVDCEGRSCLMIAALHGYDDIVSQLVEYGASVSVRESTCGWRASHFAASKGYCEVLKVLVEADSDLSAKTVLHETVEDIAIEHKQNMAAIWIRQHCTA